jgi:nucleoside-diphosphate-sugar epimerase
MKIIIVGASGRVGSKVDEALSDRHKIIRNFGDVVD